MSYNLFLVLSGILLVGYIVESISPTKFSYHQMPTFQLQCCLCPEEDYGIIVEMLAFDDNWMCKVFWSELKTICFLVKR